MEFLSERVGMAHVFSAPEPPGSPAGAARALEDRYEPARCPACALPFDADQRAPVLLACQHHACLACAGPDLRCALCGARSAPPPAPEPCPVHALPVLWCVWCAAPACCACAGHSTHALLAEAEARAVFSGEARTLHRDLQRLGSMHRQAKLRALDATTALQLRLEAELAAPRAEPEPPEPASASSAAKLCEWLRARRSAAVLQARLDDLVHRADAPLDAQALRGALVASGAELGRPEGAGATGDPLLQLGNYCAAALFARGPRSPPGPAGPRFFLELHVDGAPAGRVVVALRPDAAPRMACNFAALATGACGVGYAGCAVFKCWTDESVITGDVECNDGRGGLGLFEPDESPLACVRGAVGMRRARRRRGRAGLVGTQFRIVLQEMRTFSAVFGAVVDGLPLVDRLSRTGDPAGKPASRIIIASCGQLD